MALSFPGIGSGLDVNAIVDQLVAMERRPIELLETAKTKLTSQLSSMGLLQSYMVNLQSAAGQLAKPDFWTKNTASSSDATMVSVTARASAVPGSHSIEVTSLATSQSLSSAVIADPANVGTGTLTITLGGTPVQVAVDAGTSLAGLRDKINAADAGVTAAIVQDGSGSRLTLTGKNTGAANAVTVSVAGATGDLASLTYPGGLTENRPAADAQLKVNNLPLTSASNTLENVIDGLDITLSKTTSGPVTVTVSHDATAMRKGINDFVAAYNAVNSYLNTQTKYDEGTKTAGTLQGDRTAVGLLNTLRGLAGQPSAASAVYGRLSDMGIAVQRDGSLKVEDDAKLTTALANPAELSKAFATTDTGLAHGFKRMADAMLGVQGMLTTRSDGLRASVKRNDRDQDRLEDRVARIEERLLRQYQALDAKMGVLNGLSSYVTQQMTMLNNQFNYDK
ncbi:flagellar filament capping protein FliD [Piscinibacter sp.]|uniref:flagellar filament capping protein FliD n=1 Tax=Piscinibacter sp. TaxID=1903157 RepID=UPI002CACCE93|nr:flagellar filament capping protein FliD [Albitalea sp.]HUG22548.1 flagellar filament capping protein FliD [Albitalea sp.]